MSDINLEIIEEGTEGQRTVTVLPDVHTRYFDLLKLIGKYSSSDESSLTINFSQDASNFENHLNEARLQEYRTSFSREFLDSIRSSDFEFGVDSVADVFLRGKLGENAFAVKEWINELFIENFHDPTVTSGILRVAAHLDYSQISPQGPTMAIAAMSHNSLEIKELGIRAFENWATRDSLTTLETLEIGEQWLKDYLDDVIDGLRKIHNP